MSAIIYSLVIVVILKSIKDLLVCCLALTNPTFPDKDSFLSCLVAQPRGLAVDQQVYFIK